MHTDCQKYRDNYSTCPQANKETTTSKVSAARTTQAPP
jgi:hypothetical protein